MVIGVWIKVHSFAMVSPVVQAIFHHTKHAHSRLTEARIHKHSHKHTDSIRMHIYEFLTVWWQPLAIKLCIVLYLSIFFASYSRRHYQTEYNATENMFQKVLSRNRPTHQKQN